jgi:hypothetical protein
MPSDPLTSRFGNRAGRLLGPPVVVVLHVDGVLVDVPQHLHRERRELRLGVVADEPVRDERVVVGVHPDAVNRLHTGITDAGDHGVRERRQRHRSGQQPRVVVTAPDSSGTHGGGHRPGASGARHQVAPLQLRQKEPAQHGHTATTRNCAEDGMVVRPDQLGTLGGVHPQGRVRPGVEERVDTRRVAEQAGNLQGDRRLRRRRSVGDERVDPHFLAISESDQRVAGHAVAHGGRRIVSRGAEVAVAVDQGVAQ